MDKFYPPYFPCYIPLPNGKPAAGGKLYAYFTGTNNLAPLYAEDGTILVGSVADIDSSGQVHVLLDPAITYRLKVVPPVGSQMPDQIYDNVRVANGTIVGMENPMTDQGDMIVGGATGIPVRLAHPNGIGFLRATLSFGMKVLQWVGLTGTNGIEVTNGNSGTEIGLDTTGASEGDALKIVSGVPTWTTDAEGMQNPMTTKGDLIVGATGGEPDRLGVGADGDILASALFAGDVTPTWEAGPKKYRNVYKNIPSPDIDDGYLGCLFYLDDTATLTLPATANIPSKSFIDFVFLDNTATLTITPQGTTTLNGQGSAVTIGGKSASMYRLVFLGHGGSGDEWAVGGSVLPDHRVKASASDSTAAGSLNEKVLAIYPLKKELTTTGSPATERLNIKLNTSDDVSNVGDVLTRTAGGADWVAPATQPGDHKTAVDGADSSPDYLAAKLSAGTGISLTNTGSAVQIAATAQTGDHKLLTTSADTSAGYLADKLVAGSNITLTQQTDGDGVQTLEISATGGGGGMTNPMTGFGQMIFGGPGGAPSVLSSALAAGKYLKSINVGSGRYQPVWADLPSTCQENFSLLNVTNFYDAGQQTNKLFCSKVVANATAKRSKLAFFHKSGDVGKAILGVYDNAGNLLAQTAPFRPDSSTFEQMCWNDTLASFTLTAGEEYWFAAYFTPDNWSCTVNALGLEKSSAFDVNLVGSRSVGVLTELPATLGTLSYETLAWYMSAM